MRYRSWSLCAETLAVISLAVCIATIGCRPSEHANVVPVTGRVLFNGEPLKYGSIIFQPAHGQPARGEILPNGDFTLSTYRVGDGAAVGRHKVRVTCYTSQDPSQKKEASAASDSLGDSLIPLRYTSFDTSGLEVALLAGGNKPFVFELKSEPSPEKSKSEGESGEAASAVQSPTNGSGRKSKSEAAATKSEPAEKK